MVEYSHRWLCYIGSHQRLTKLIECYMLEQLNNLEIKLEYQSMCLRKMKTVGLIILTTLHSRLIKVEDEDDFEDIEEQIVGS